MRMAGGYRVMWNQLVDFDERRTLPTSAGVVPLYPGGTSTYPKVAAVSAGRKYYVNLNLSVESGTFTQNMTLYISGSGGVFSWNALTSAAGYKFIQSAQTNIPAAKGYLSFRLYKGNEDADTTIVTIRPMIIDLTQMFGEGNEPPTVAAFEQWLAENHLDGYQPYNEGEEITTTKPSWL